MAKLKQDEIKQQDLIEFINDHSDFSFEIKILNQLIDLGFDCEHGGTYDDPITKKPREFDIRATKSFKRKFIRFAIECKNLRQNYPLLISCLPRREVEAFHELIFSVKDDTYNFYSDCLPLYQANHCSRSSKKIRPKESCSLYKQGEPVGKSCEQVGRTRSGEELTSGDEGIYDKWSQALNSADDLIYLARQDAEETGCSALSIVMPILVVPDGRLWTVEFDKNGKLLTDPKLAHRCSYFIDRQYSHIGLEDDTITISHLEIVTLQGLINLIKELCGDEKAWNKTLPLEKLISD